VLIQLVSALKYEVLDVASSPLMIFLNSFLGFDLSIVSKFYWNLNIEKENNRILISKFYDEAIKNFMI